MTDRRERIARCIAPQIWSIRDTWPPSQDTYEINRQGSLRTADAVLAALADDLLPEIPDGWTVESVSLADVIDGVPSYEALISEDEPKDWSGTYPWAAPLRQGTGPTIPSAINDALDSRKTP